MKIYLTTVKLYSLCTITIKKKFWKQTKYLHNSLTFAYTFFNFSQNCKVIISYNHMCQLSNQKLIFVYFNSQRYQAKSDCYQMLKVVIIVSDLTIVVIKTLYTADFEWRTHKKVCLTIIICTISQLHHFLYLWSYRISYFLLVLVS